MSEFDTCFGAIVFGTLPEDEHPTIAVHPSPKTEKSFQRNCFRYCDAMFVRLGNCLLIVALITATGGHWAALQTIAWTNMLAENLRTASLEEALTKTFDGKNPCKLCKSIDEGKRAERKSEVPPDLKKLEFVNERPDIVLTSPRQFWSQFEASLTLSSLAHKPPVPPPRSLAA